LEFCWRKKVEINQEKEPSNSSQKTPWIDVPLGSYPINISSIGYPMR
jgi:hypothetical protein